MAIGDRTYFGYQPDPNLTSPLANLTDLSRQGSSGNQQLWVDLHDTGNMPDGVYKYRMDFQIYNTSGADKYFRIDAGTEDGNIGYSWSTGLVIGQMASKAGIIKVDRGVGHKLTMKYPNGWFGLVVTFQYIGALT